MSINATLLAQMVVFALLVWFTMRFVWPPLMRAMAERQQRINDGLAAAQAGERQQAEARTQAEAELNKARGASAEIISQSERRAQQIVEEAREEARREGERLLESARSQIEQERNRAREDLRGRVADLAVTGAEKILAREVDRSRHGEMLQDLAAQL